MTITHKLTPYGNGQVRVTTFGPKGTSTKTCNTVAEAQAFIATVKARSL